jgi:hypothetical protein
MKIIINNSIICFSENPIFNRFYNDYSMGLHLLLDFYADDRRFIMNFSENGIEKKKFICDVAYEEIESKMFYVQNHKQLELYDKIIDILFKSRNEMINKFKEKGDLEFRIITE